MNRQLKRNLIFVLIILFSALLFWGLGDAMGPLLFSVALAYLSFPVIAKIEKRRVPRQLAVAGVFSFLVLLILGLLTFILPTMVSELRSFLVELPENASRTFGKIQEIAIYFGLEINLSKASLYELTTEYSQKVSKEFLYGAANFAKEIFSSFTESLLALINLFLIPVFFFYIISDYEGLKEKIKNRIPLRSKPLLFKYGRWLNDILSGYLRGQFSVALLLSLIYGLGLWLIGLKFGLLIGVVTGLLSIVPYVGFSLGFASSLLVALANSSGWPIICMIIVLFLLAQLLEGFVITPKLVGGKLGLNAFETLLALIIGGNLLGVLGMLMAIPTGAFLKRVISEVNN